MKEESTCKAGRNARGILTPVCALAQNDRSGLGLRRCCKAMTKEKKCPRPGELASGISFCGEDGESGNKAFGTIQGRSFRGNFQHGGGFVDQLQDGLLLLAQNLAAELGVFIPADYPAGKSLDLFGQIVGIDQAHGNTSFQIRWRAAGPAV